MKSSLTMLEASRRRRVMRGVRPRVWHIGGLNGSQGSMLQMLLWRNYAVVLVKVRCARKLPAVESCSEIRSAVASLTRRSVVRPRRSQFGIYRPDNVSTGTRVVFLMHGSTRTGQEARDIGATYAKHHHFVLLALEFSEKNYPSDSYAFGNMINTDRKPVPESKWAFGVIERVFDMVRHELRLSTDSYDILGHSAGGQFAHRLVLLAPQSRFRRAVASSPGRYAFPIMSASFPYGFKGSGLASSLRARAFSKDFVLVPGDRDTSDRVREAEATPQGGNRFARGLRSFAAATEEANALKVPLAWRLRIARGADHSPNAAVQAGFAELLR